LSSIILVHLFAEAEAFARISCMWEMKKIYLDKSIPPHDDLSAERIWKPYNGKVLPIT